MFQEYDTYTADDHATWERLYSQQFDALRERGHPSHGAGLEAFGISERIPDLTRLNERLRASVGWTVEPVAGQVPGEVFSGLLRSRRLPTTVHIRSRTDLKHSKVPDMFHDIFGHAPLLSIAAYREFLERFGEISGGLLHDRAASARLGNGFKWTIEYGLISEDGVRAYGAGLMSSAGELDHALDAGVPKPPFDPRAAVGTPHTPAAYQRQYFVIGGFAELGEHLEHMARHAQVPAKGGRR
ncbi:phenylalanine 4-monooxygenase [Actinomadura sp. KC216]|uniref:phenylalanine 4-monooxygenase n=1 Tax=Actinomadura sp. KC216 TaxID=2530370 RepID=UPI001046B5B3|nr:phenylalanine 4-monooxygenase [Actinomadura sp. KC216]TDB79924.1 phenylalanine 4-monooxygenase [Actinomadura sp. KC216]